MSGSSQECNDIQTHFIRCSTHREFDVIRTCKCVHAWQRTKHAYTYINKISKNMHVTKQVRENEQQTIYYSSWHIKKCPPSQLDVPPCFYVHGNENVCISLSNIHGSRSIKRCKSLSLILKGGIRETVDLTTLGHKGKFIGQVSHIYLLIEGGWGQCLLYRPIFTWYTPMNRDDGMSAQRHDMHAGGLIGSKLTTMNRPMFLCQSE